MTQSIFTPVGSGVVVAAAASALPFPPTVWGNVPHWASTLTQRTVPEFDLIVWSDDTDNLTAAQLWAGIPLPLTIAAEDTVSVAHPIITDTSHGFFTGDGPIQLTTSGAIPAGLALATDYWIIKIDANTYKLAASFADSMAATPVPVVFTGNGTGTLTVTGTSACKRVHWCGVEVGDVVPVGPASDGAIALTSQKGWRQRFEHAPMVVAYAISGTLSAGHCSVTLFPIGRT